ncbi:hypothetical protein [Pedobacter nyackensis]|uniref:hypothetical protein n=1 Tax=Pedobacter nyackensis TaxID=475255 RepID=UPI00292DD545|nr:hypothetical protein [Pedobacter nyackensis]
MKQFFFTVFALLTLNSTYGQVKATSSEINTGTDDDKFATALALQGSKYLDQNGAKVSAVTAAGANTYTASINPAITAYSMGQVFYIKITTANTGASTLNLNGLGAKTLVKDASAVLVSGDLLANKVYAVYYDGTNFQVMNAPTAGGNYVLKSGDTMTGQLNGTVGAFSGSLYGLRLGVGTAGAANNVGINHTANLEGASSAVGYQMTTNIGSDVTSGGYGFRTSLSTVPSSTVLSNLTHFSAAQRAFGAGSSVSLQTGFEVSSTLVGGATNRGFSSGIPAGTNNYNLYMSGTARNYLVGNLGIGTDAVSSAKLEVLGITRLTNAGNSLQLYSTTGTGNTYMSYHNNVGTRLGYVGLGSGTNNNMYIVSDLGSNAYVASAHLFKSSAATVYDNNAIGIGKMANHAAVQIDGFGVGTRGFTFGTEALPSGYQLELFKGGVSAKGITKIERTSSLQYMQIDAEGGTGNILGKNPLTADYLQLKLQQGNSTTNRDVLTVGNDGMVTVPFGVVADVTGNATTATSAKVLSAIPQYTWTHDMLPNNYSLGIQSSFVQPGAPGGWQNYGSVMTMRTYGAGGGTLQLYTPYGTINGGDNLQVRFGNYSVNSGNSWTGWKTLMNQGDNAASATKLATPRTINGVSFDGSANITIDAATQASVATLDANAVHKTGNETIAGVKLFSTSVGIGTTNVHSYKLAVGGGIMAESVKVKPQAQWPDYVFEKDYPILPLNELEKFVLKNKHLPNIPNAAEVKKEGIDVGEMNAKLLQKIEELTLYLIELKKENETLKSRVDKIEKNTK